MQKHCFSSNNFEAFYLDPERYHFSLHLHLKTHHLNSHPKYQTPFWYQLNSLNLTLTSQLLLQTETSSANISLYHWQELQSPASPPNPQQDAKWHHWMRLCISVSLHSLDRGITVIYSTITILCSCIQKKEQELLILEKSEGPRNKMTNMDKAVFLSLSSE